MRVYSTRGGFLFNAVLLIIPWLSRCLSFLTIVRVLTPERDDCKSLKRLGIMRRSRMISKVKVSPTKLAVFAIGHAPHIFFSWFFVRNIIATTIA